jgi:2-phospho-L-lactate guanylyltransferase (CobY/MobA/RfbA family)
MEPNKRQKMKCSSNDSTLILVTKFPTKGVSKTRLYPAIGEENAYQLAKAMLTDLLNSFSSIPARKILYVPHKSQSLATDFCKEFSPLWDQWSVQPMPIEDETNRVTSSDLSNLLSHALRLVCHGSTLHTRLNTLFPVD